MPKTMGILGKKIGMTRVYDELGVAIPVTVIEAGPCTVLQVKTTAKEGYNAVQLGFAAKKPSRVNKPMTGHCVKAGAEGFYDSVHAENSSSRLWSSPGVTRGFL